MPKRKYRSFNEIDFVRIDTLSKWEDSKMIHETELTASKCMHKNLFIDRKW